MFPFFQRQPPTPKVIYLRGEPTKTGQDIQEQPQHLGEILQSLAPPALLLRLPETIQAAALQVIPWLWQERGFHFPPITLERATHPTLTVLDQGETPLHLAHPHFTATEQAQLQLQSALLDNLPRFLNRDYVLTQAPDLDPRLLSRLSKYLRTLLQAGWTLPSPDQWHALASQPFDEIARGLEPVHARIPLQPQERTELLFQALIEERTGPAIFQAIEEFWVASGRIFPLLQTTSQNLIRELLRNPAEDLHNWARHTPDFEEQILQSQQRPATTLPRFTRLAILGQDLSSEAKIPFAQVLATPAQERWARQRLGP
ncbi:hypothetical protein ABS71_12235 [bacterium SCN 62-11]|nr:hypothetical protein [Candidatus Eremiobacteraeota bacterium]ODT65354.1 MAG: hypothetical protein ABS71_12235 [bacterium SCN 62-11]